MFLYFLQVKFILIPSSYSSGLPGSHWGCLSPGLHKHCRPRAGKMVILVYVFREGSCDYNYDLGGNGPGPGNCDL